MANPLTEENKNDSLSDCEENDIIEEDDEIEDDDDEEDNFIPRVNFVCVGDKTGSTQIHWIHHGRRFKGFYRTRGKDKNIKTIFCHKNGAKNPKNRCHYSFKARCKYEHQDSEFWNANHWVTLPDKQRKNRNNSHIDITDDTDRLKESLTKNVTSRFSTFVKLI